MDEWRSCPERPGDASGFCCRGNDLLDFEFRKWTVAILCVRAPAALSVHDDTSESRFAPGPGVIYIVTSINVLTSIAQAGDGSDAT